MKKTSRYKQASLFLLRRQRQREKISSDWCQSEISFEDLLQNREKLCPATHWGLAEMRKAEDFESFLVSML